MVISPSKCLVCKGQEKVMSNTRIKTPLSYHLCLTCLHSSIIGLPGPTFMPAGNGRELSGSVGQMGTVAYGNRRAFPPPQRLQAE